VNTIPIADHCALLDELYHLSRAPSGRPYSLRLTRRIERALADAGSIEAYKPSFWSRLWDRIGRDPDAPSFFRKY
jgi:hypothetical protein